jgi:4-alpha-glucanotransferase
MDDDVTQTLRELAAAAGIETAWRDVHGREQVVSEDSLRAVLAAIGLPAATDADIDSSFATLRQERGHNILPLITADVGRPIPLSGDSGPYRITLESGEIVDGFAVLHEGLLHLPAVRQPGYHRLEFNDTTTTIAVAPPRAFTLDDAAGGAKLFGLAVQLYSLRRHGDGGIGDFGALEEFVRHATAQGVDAVAISPVHAQFSADITRYGPYAPSNRAALNVLHIAQHTDVPEEDLIDWPRSAARKLANLRESFKHFHDHAALEAFRAEAGMGLENHAVFEALAEVLTQQNPAALDYRTWPAAYQDPANPAVARFREESAQAVRFHAYLQYRADLGLAGAQAAAKAGGAKIGLIADLAVGTDHAGSASWSRQDEVLRGLEIGAPPDLINREGQSWGITAFSPRGLRNSGFSAFIDMLRHALRHAGGVRIDHVMGLARLWVIPLGAKSSEGAYLRMPEADLMRLVVLESQRHRAVILGEDLGTLPYGFGPKLNEAGIAGLRVMWFEREGQKFNPPSHWTKTAVAMTTTHDLPTVTGWWEGNDIAWRDRLNMAGDDAAAREKDRVALWQAFRDSGAAAAAMPDAGDGQAASYAACAHLGAAACTLALLPIEDALSLPEQPNLPGTTTEHPNWRRRLPGDAAAIFGREDVMARLKVLKQARGA